MTDPANLPTGTVTFLFTDIEGSTKRWEAYPGHMQAALTRHDDILRAAIQQNGGYVFKTMGDAFCAAFGSPADALQAALSAQLALFAEQWAEEIGSLRVRMALYTGVAEERERDFFGQPLNRAARLLSAGHGGQVLLSAATYETVRDSLPERASLLDLGEHGLKDLFRPEHIYQLSAPGLLSQFPHLNTLDSRPNNLPRQPTPLIGREKELARLAALLRKPDVVLITLTGAGGSGKTRLALQVAADLLDDFRDGVWLVELAAISEPKLVVPTIAQVLGVKEAAGQPLLGTLSAYLKEKQLLLVLDNFEQVVGSANQIGRLLAVCPQIEVLVTSRVPLKISGEKEHPVPPLQLPDATHLPGIAQLTQYEAVRLFIERATDIKPGFEITNDNAPAVAEICVRLDGLPLAIELAAARVRIFPPQALLGRLSSRLKLLTGGARDLPARQQTLRNTIDWSYDLLDEGEKQLLRRMAVFQGGRTLEALEAVCNCDGQLKVEVTDGVESLISNSLLQQREGYGGEPRFWMLETIHEYARDRLQESGEAKPLEQAHALFFAAFVEAAEPELRKSEQEAWLARFDEDYDNIRAALRWAERGEDPGDVDAGLRMVHILGGFWLTRGYYAEARSHTLSLLSKAAPVPSLARARALGLAGRMSANIGKYAEAALLLEQSVAVFRQIGHRRGIASALGSLSGVMYAQGELIQSRALQDEGLSIWRELGDVVNVAGSLGSMAENDRYAGDYDQACSRLEEAAQTLRAVGDKEILATILGNWGNTLACMGDPQAEALLTEALVMNAELGYREQVALTLQGLGGVAAVLGQPERGARLLGAGEALVEAIGMVLWPADRKSHDLYSAELRARLGEEAFEQARQEGRGMSMEQAIRYALRDYRPQRGG